MWRLNLIKMQPKNYLSFVNFKYIYSPHVWLTKKLTYTSLVSTGDDANKTRPVTGQKCGILALFLQGYYISVEISLSMSPISFGDDNHQATFEAEISNRSKYNDETHIEWIIDADPNKYIQILDIVSYI